MKKEERYDSHVEVTHYDVDWMRIKSACMTTISKQAGKTPNTLWKKKLLICRHSPIRRGNLSWNWRTIPYAISTHFVRHHEGCEKFIGTERTDRTGVDRRERSQMNYVPMEMDANIQALMNISEKRLCMCADPTTRQYWEELLEEIRKIDPLLVWCCVPQCVRCGGCVEPFSECKYYETMMKDVTLEDHMNVMKRYDIYNKRARNLTIDLDDLAQSKDSKDTAPKTLNLTPKKIKNDETK